MAPPNTFPAIDFVRFHREELPARLAGDRAQMVADATAGLSSLALRLPDGVAFTYRPDGDRGFAISSGDDGATAVMELDLDSWRGLVHELEAPAGLLYARRVRCLRGDPIDLMKWESGLRALYNGRPLYDPAKQLLSDRHGRRLDPETTFSASSPPDEMAYFLRETGYLFVRNVLTADELPDLLAEADTLRKEARRGDKLSWWGKNEAGEEVLCRVTRGIHKPHLASLPADPRLHGLKALVDESWVYKRGEGEGVTVIYKQPGVSEGLGDLPWHRDCGMGGHAANCPTLVVSVYLTAATPETGELAMLPGSHRASFNAHDRRCDPNRHAAHFRAQPGDVSLHFSDTLHAAPPPSCSGLTRYRISTILTFARPDARHHRGESSYNDVLHQRDDGQIEHLETVAKRR